MTTAETDAPPEAEAAFRPVAHVASWGRLERPPHQVARPWFRDALPRVVSALSADRPGLAVGLRRSYGDSALNPGGRLIDMTGLDRLISFDRETGLVRAEAGISLSQLIAVLAPEGWFPPTVPGSRFVTLGGAVANDVHGKNHVEVGSFGNWVTRLKLHRSDGPARETGLGEPLFHATVGGLGLTGLIEWVEFQATPIGGSFLDVEETPFASLDGYFELMASRSGAIEHNVAWIDCFAQGAALGRGVLSSASWAAAGSRRIHRERPGLAAPFDLPGFALNRLTVGGFNAAYRSAKSFTAGRRTRHYADVFFPLDGVAGWNRLYGGRGFYQYQCVVPRADARAAITDLLTLISNSGQGSFLAVLKEFGPIEPVGLLSFPMEGSTLALDFPNRGQRTLDLFRELDAVVAAAAGRIYPAKDARAPADLYRAGYPGLAGFGEFIDPAFRSGFRTRVMG